jgi:hypothetical protein
MTGDEAIPLRAAAVWVREPVRRRWRTTSHGSTAGASSEFVLNLVHPRSGMAAPGPRRCYLAERRIDFLIHPFRRDLIAILALSLHVSRAFKLTA